MNKNTKTNQQEYYNIISIQIILIQMTIKSIWF